MITRVASRIYILLVFSCLSVNAQDNADLPKNDVMGFFAYSKHGTDWVGGFAWDIEYSHHFPKKFFWSVGAGTTVHDGTVLEIEPGQDISLDTISKPFTTAGAQVFLQIGTSVIRNQKHELQVKIGPLLRYQSSSNPESINIAYWNGKTDNTDYPLRTLSFGGIGTISYAYTFDCSVFIRVQAALQYDTNDDAINMFGLGIGKRF